MKRTGKSYTVKEWFTNKVATELKRNLTMCDVFCIFKETEKAVYAMLNIGCHTSKCMWVPKSVLVENEEFADYKETYKSDDYDEALKEFHAMWDMFC